MLRAIAGRLARGVDIRLGGVEAASIDLGVRARR
jgi:hypothetical protein